MLNGNTSHEAHPARPINGPNNNWYKMGEYTEAWLFGVDPEVGDGTRRIDFFRQTGRAAGAATVTLHEAVFNSCVAVEWNQEVRAEGENMDPTDLMYSVVAFWPELEE